MLPIKVNVDYESELFQGRPKAVLNRSLEFLAFYLTDAPVFVHRSYDEEYLDYVEAITSQRPRVLSSGPSVNWWGALKDVCLERKLNSKLTSSELILSEGWCSQTKIIHSASDLNHLTLKGLSLIKDPYGMSGQGLKKIGPNEKIEFSGKPFIIEPLLQRVHDFSHYFYPNGRKVIYQNFVDDRFQYRGTLIAEESLSFLESVESDEWTRFQEALEKIKSFFFTPSIPTGFSVDSFTYKEGHQLKIRHLSEINYRLTMGSVAHGLMERYSQGRRWNLLALAQGESNLTYKESLEMSSMGIFRLSPEGERFHVFFLTAENQNQGRDLYYKLRALLPNTKFAINF